MSFLYEKSIYDLKQKKCANFRYENILISNAVTFKYECYLFYNKRHAIDMSEKQFFKTELVLASGN